MTARQKHPNQAGTGSESAEQQALVTWWRTGGRVSLGLPPHAILLAVPNGGWRHPSTAARLRAEGVTPGVPDLLLAMPRGRYAGLWIEMKRSRSAGGGSLSAAQREVLPCLASAGYAVAVAYGWQDAVGAMRDYVSGAMQREVRDVD